MMWHAENKLINLYRSANRTITGSGVILLETYFNELCVTLFCNKQHNRYEDGGGNLDGNETEREGAVRELKEESCNLFRLNPNSLSTYYDHYITYRAYVVHVNGPMDKSQQISGARYYHNLNLLQTNGARHEWRETNQIGRFKVSQLLKDGLLTKKGDLNTTLSTPLGNGKDAIIFSRTKACIRELYTQTSGFTNVPKIQLKNNSNFQAQTFLNGTKCYYS